MPWKVSNMSEVRFAACHAVRSLRRPVAVVARQFGVSRKTLHKWLRLFDAKAQPSVADLADRSRRPRRCPRRTHEDLQQRILQVRQQYNWGPRKIYGFLLHQARHNQHPMPPAIRTVAYILQRHRGQEDNDPATAPELIRFERSQPNQLWQIDHKGPVEVARSKVMPLSILDDHSRYCLAFTPCLNLTMATAWDVLWGIFEPAGLPEAILADNSFRAHGGFTTDRCPGLSWFDARLIRLGIDPHHGRPYHPQTQGKVERFHGSSNRELLNFNARRDCLEHFVQDCEHYRCIYNTIRPHEALADHPPVSRWQPSPRIRPAQLPDVTYPAGSILRKVSTSGDVRYQGYRILCGRGITGQLVRIEEHDHQIVVFYCHKSIRCLPSLSKNQRQPDIML
jgi:transposase InsO family protein